LLRSLGVEIDVHGKMPDVTVYAERKSWLVLIEAVTSHGPVNPKRRGDLKALFKDCKAGLVFVTAFLGPAPPAPGNAEPPSALPWDRFFAGRDDSIGIEWELRVRDLNKKAEWDRWKILEAAPGPARS